MNRLIDLEEEIFEELNSTQDKAKEIIGQGTAIHGKVIVALKQTQGRGRENKQWISKEGDIAFTLILKPQAEDPAQICYVAALAVEEVLRKILADKKVQLKWINDVLVNEKKISGILLEKTSAGFILVGIGLNIRDNEDHAALNATSLEASKCKANADYIREQILERFCYFYNLWVDYGFALIRAQWLIAAYGLNKQVEVRTRKDRRLGIFIGIDTDGNMLMLENNRIISAVAGEVCFD